MVEFFMTSFQFVLILTFCSQNIEGTKTESCTIASEECLPEEIGFFAYTQENQGKPIQLHISEPRTSLDSLFDVNKPFKVIVHGYTQNKDNIYMMGLRMEYLKQDVNLIFVDYGNVARNGCKQIAIQNTPIVAKCTAQALRLMIDTLPDVKPEHFHLIGFSMGAQIVGRIGIYFTDEKLGRMTGLDPGFSGYYEVFDNDDLVLTRDDALFVDVLHTNSGIIGKLLPVGHIDFYANSGIFQPGCNYGNNELISGIGYTAGDLCSHARAVEYFTESINTDIPFRAYKCKNVIEYFNGKCSRTGWIVFGEHVTLTYTGVYHFSTNEKQLYVPEKARSPLLYVMFNRFYTFLFSRFSSS